MIGSVRGIVLERSPSGEVLIEVGGVGYRCLVPLSTIPTLALGEPAFLFTHLHAREDALLLYGFPSRDERDTFEALIAATGVGPKLGLSILSVHSPAALRRTVLDDDVASLTLVPGVGPRTAQRLLVELRSRLEVPEPEPTARSGAGSARADVRQALAGLGYGTEEIREVIGILPEDGSAEDLLRVALKQLATVR